MRGRLVHQQEIRRIEQQFDQRQPAFFAAAEHADFFEDVVAAKQKAAEQRANELFGDALRGVERFFENGAVRVEHVHAILREITGLDVVPEFALRLVAASERPREF